MKELKEGQVRVSFGKNSLLLKVPAKAHFAFFYSTSAASRQAWDFENMTEAEAFIVEAKEVLGVDARIGL